MTFKMFTTRSPDLARLAGCVVLVMLAGCAGPMGPPVTQQRGVDAFHSVDLRAVGTVDILVGPPASLSLTADAKTLEDLDVHVQAGMLIIDEHRHWSWFGRSGQLQIRLTAPALNSIALNGAGALTVNGLNGGPLALVVQGAGNIEASGNVDILTARINGAGNMDLARVEAREATVSVNGAGSLEVNATESLDATLNGVGSINYDGNPKNLTTSINGVGSISPTHTQGIK
jgi:Putative auto-transporter adhesin, head GIN domain